MTSDFVMDYIVRRMEELQLDFHVRYRSFQLKPSEKRTVLAHAQLFMLLEPAANVRIESYIGMYDLGNDTVNELQFEHQGEIILTNLSESINNVQFVQVIPKNK